MAGETANAGDLELNLRIIAVSRELIAARRQPELAAALRTLLTTLRADPIDWPAVDGAQAEVDRVKAEGDSG